MVATKISRTLSRSPMWVAGRGQEIKQMLVDAHCHISTDFDASSADELVNRYAELRDVRFVVMSTNHIDCEHVHAIAQRLDNVVPSFGVHPWYSHLFTLEDGIVDKRLHYSAVFKKDVDDDLLAVLPEPINFDTHITKLRSLCQHHKVVCWGEIGLDKLFKIPSSGFYANPVFRDTPSSEIKLTNYRVSMDHQKEIFIRQLRIAFEMGISVSIHNVKTSGAIHDLIRGELTPSVRSSICLHSYTGSVDTLKMFISTFRKHKGSKFYASFSSVLNNCGPKKEELGAMLDVLPRSCVLSETDVTLDGFIAEGGPLDLLKDIVKALAIEEQTLEDNCCSFLGIDSFA